MADEKALAITPTEIPHCAGRLAVAHERTAMQQAGAEWVCSVCGEVARDPHPLTRREDA